MGKGYSIILLIFVKCKDSSLHRLKYKREEGIYMTLKVNEKNYNTDSKESIDQLKLIDISDSKILDIIMRHSLDTIYFKDRNSKFLANSQAHANQFGYANSKELVGMSDFDFFPEEFARRALLDEQRIMETGIPIVGKEEKWDTPEGKSIWFSAYKYPIFNEQGEIIGTWGTSRDITALKQTQEELAKTNDQLETANLKLKKLSEMDGLTELYNQRKFQEVLEETINTYKRIEDLGAEAGFCVMLMDIDGFKRINDQFGHPMGDKAIRHLADIIRTNKRENDICFRYGGDEFAVILPNTQLNQALSVGELFRRKIEESSLDFEGGKIQLTISVGVEAYHLGDSVYELLTRTDKKLYVSKKKGKNQVN